MEERMVRGVLRSFVLGTIGVLLPAMAFAQASITGVARDTSGAVLPGVTVEAASPVLIEKVRSTVTDGNGRYQLVDLRPGTYTVTFTLTGFNTVRREMVTLAGSAAAAVDAEMRVGALEETITVTGEAPVVDVQSTTRQTVLGTDTIATLPTWRNLTSLTTLIPGTTGADGNNERAAGLQGTGGSVGIHGARAGDQRVTLNGVNIMTLQASGAVGGQSPDVGSAAEVTVDTSSVSADLPTGGVRINFIPRDGGNQWANSTFFTYGNSSLQSDNLSDDLIAAGLPAAERLKENWDLAQSFGGPMRRDRVWFWASIRHNGIDNYAPIFLNKNAFDVTKWTYEPSTEQAVNSGRLFQTSLRLTWQATPRNKIAGTYKADTWCECPDNISATTSAEAGRDRRFPMLRQTHLEWTSPMTSRVLADAVGMHLYERWGNMHLQNERTLDMLGATAAVIPQLISVQEQSTGMTYRMGTTWNNNSVPNYAYRASLSYVTGSHNFKVGFNRTHGYQTTRTYNFQPYSYRFNRGVPNRITIYATPYELRNHMDNDLGIFAQDRWTMDRLTVTMAVRFDTVQTSFPEQRFGPGPLVPSRNLVFAAQDNLDYHDLGYRSGLTWDVFGTGRTAVKLSANKYLAAQTLSGLGSAPNPFNTLVNQTTRSWNDDGRNGGIANDFMPQCNLTLPAANGECGGMANTNFGTSVPGATYDPDLLTGMGHRGSNWEFSAGAQHELFPRISLDVSYYRRIYQSFSVVDNLALSAADFDFFSITVPSHPELPNGGGYTLEGLRTLKPSAFGRPAQNLNTLASKLGKQTEHWNGVDVLLNARLQNGVTLQVGTSTGRTSENDCELSAQLPENNLARPLQFCDRQTPWLTQLKGYVTYMIPRVDVQVAATYRDTPGEAINASFSASNAYLAANSTLGRPLAGGESNITFDLLEPNTKYLDRRHQLDLRFGKVFRVSRYRAALNLDLYNAINANTVVDANDSFDTWLAPTSILNGRLVKISANFDF
jgi:hypothetical protein